MLSNPNNIVKVENVTFGASSAKAARHDELVGRTLPDQHPISSISGLEEALLKAGTSFMVDETLSLEGGVLSVNTASEPEEDNTLPITSAAVATTVGNIEVILQTI